MKNIVLSICVVLSSLCTYAQKDTISGDEEILKLYQDLRVADVSDGMDMIGLPDVGLMDQKITSLWRDMDNFSHRICGIALTVRYVPTNRIIRTPVPEKDYDAWVSNWYNQISPEPFVNLIKRGSVIVIEQAGNVDCGTVGSANGLFWMTKGARGVISNGGIRDIDELIKEKVPVYMDFEKRGRGIRPGRNEFESMNKPVIIGGVLIRPGDVIVADSDGVIVVPREKAVEVARYAHKIIDGDKKARKDLYKQMNIPADKTVE